MRVLIFTAILSFINAHTIIVIDGQTGYPIQNVNVFTMGDGITTDKQGYCNLDIFNKKAIYIYIREMTMFKDTFVIGAIHKHLHMCFLLKGHLSVAHEEDVVEYKAPCFIVSKPGIKRVLYAHEESIWYNTHQNPTNTEDIMQLEKELVCINYQEYEEYINQNK